MSEQSCVVLSDGGAREGNRLAGVERSRLDRLRHFGPPWREVDNFSQNFPLFFAFHKVIHKRSAANNYHR